MKSSELLLFDELCREFRSGQRRGQTEKSMNFATTWGWDHHDSAVVIPGGSDPFSFPEKGTEVKSRKPVLQSSHRVVLNKSMPTPESSSVGSHYGTSEPPKKVIRSHRKSRRGCFNCKARKIKCSETQPECQNCVRRGVECTYPKPKTLSALRSLAAYSPSPINAVNLQSTPTMFTLTDMRLFHHFLTIAHPHLPLGNDTVWTGQVPLVAHHNEYLMHAMLGMAASHLELTTGQDLRAIALSHRVLAIKGFNAALSKPRRTGADGDTLLAACYALTFQSSYMPETLIEFFQMVRGCGILNEQLVMEGLPMAFFLDRKDHFGHMKDKLADLPSINPKLIEGARKSLSSLFNLFDRPEHLALYRPLADVIDAIEVSSLKAYFQYLFIFQGILKLSTAQIDGFLSPDNHAAKLLLAHFLPIQIILSPIVHREWPDHLRTTPILSGLVWMNSLYETCPLHLRSYLAWPKLIGDQVALELAGELPVIPITTAGNKKGPRREGCLEAPPSLRSV